MSYVLNSYLLTYLLKQKNATTLKLLTRNFTS